MNTPDALPAAQQHHQSIEGDARKLQESY